MGLDWFGLWLTCTAIVHVVIIGVKLLSDTLLTMECCPFLLEETMPMSLRDFSNIEKSNRGRSRHFATDREP